MKPNALAIMKPGLVETWPPKSVSDLYVLSRYDEKDFPEQMVFAESLHALFSERHDDFFVFQFDDDEVTYHVLKPALVETTALGNITLPTEFATVMGLFPFTHPTKPLTFLSGERYAAYGEGTDRIITDCYIYMPLLGDVGPMDTNWLVSIGSATLEHQIDRWEGSVQPPANIKPILERLLDDGAVEGQLIRSPFDPEHRIWVYMVKAEYLVEQPEHKRVLVHPWLTTFLGNRTPDETPTIDVNGFRLAVVSLLGNVPTYIAGELNESHLSRYVSAVSEEQHLVSLQVAASQQAQAEEEALREQLAQPTTLEGEVVKSEEPETNDSSDSVN